MNLIELEGISKVYGKGDAKTLAVKDADLVIKQGEFVAIMGPSGSGKSTLLSIIGLLDSPTKGAYAIAGESVAKKSDRWLSHFRREKIGFVFQSFNLIPRLSLLQNVELPMIYAGHSRKERRDRAKKLLEQVGLGHRLKNKSNEISGGEMQRAAIARALANNPSLILADEPTGNLDSKSSEQIMKLFQQLNKAGNTVVLITHEAHLARYARRIIKVHDGEITT